MRTLTFHTASVSFPGGREYNEDSCGVRTSREALCCVLADGLGGHLGGATASRLAVDAALDAFAHGESLPAVIAAANQAVLDRQQAEPDLASMRTTLVVLLASLAGEAQWAHAGDSRLYWFREGRLVNRTSDHSVPQRLADAGEIAPGDIRFHEDRNRLLRSLGAKPDTGATLADPVHIAAGDVFLLCSDGFWEWVEEAEMEAALAAATTPQQWLDKMVKCLEARATPENDNYSAVAALVGGNSGGSPAPEKAV